MAKVSRTLGSEGPKYDPYGYEEITVTKDGIGKAKAHFGLANWLTIEWEDGTWLEWREGEGFDLPQIVEEFERFVGCSSNALEKALNRLEYPTKCRKCGSRDLRDYSGYPGESFTVCESCGEHAAYHFNESAVI